ncbi:unnamed protein product [Paramecium primaurelia]|uniref:WD40-repeat-containing domain n=1 Tax=Paramecium primaurelia TaxID=5886 RepID=A0A8S1QIX0_PARPR|nr:unnamed protein product [Paramecium primaurelia]
MDIPSKCISFSPNWFYPQIAQMNGDLLCYGVNDQVFVYNSETKHFKYTLQGQQKVTMLYLKDQYIFVGQEGGVITMFQQQKYLGKLEFNIEIPMILKEINNQYLLLDNKGIALEFKLNDKFELIHFGLKLITQPHSIPKWGDENIVIYQSGRMYRFEQKSEYDYPYHILCVDRYKNKYGVLNKLHKAISLHVFQLDQIDEWKQTNTINDNDIFIELKFIVNEKLPTENLKKASLSIKFLDDKQIFVTSKQGEIFLIQLTNQVKSLKLDANVISDKHFYKLPQEIHIKGIYLMNNYLNQYYTVGLDRRIFSFRVEDGQIVDYHKFVCLAGKVNKLQIGKEKNLIYFHDQTLKSLDLTKNKYPTYINEFWKINDFSNFYISPFQEGIVFIQKDQKIELIDIYKEQLLDKYVCEDPISKIEWLNKKQVLMLLDLFDVEQINKDQENEFLTKPHQIQDYVLIIMLTGRMQLIDLSTGQVLFNFLIQQKIKIQQLIKNKTFDIVTINMNSIQFLFNNDLCYMFYIFNGYHVFYYQKNHFDTKQIHNTDINCIDVSLYKNNIYLLTGCNNQTISINVIHNEIILLGYLKHRFPIQKVQLQNGLITSLAKCHQSLQIWNVNEILQRMIPNRQTLEGLEKANIRGHSGFLLDFVYFTNNLVITSSEDQTIKVFDIDEIQNKLPPNKKKSKKKVKLDNQQQD